MRIYDSNDNEAQVSSTALVQLVPNTMKNVAVSFFPPILSTTATMSMKFTTNVPYSPSTYFVLSTPSTFIKGSLVCNSSLTVGTPQCTTSGDNITVISVVLSSVSNSTEITLNVSGITLPVCTGQTSTFSAFSLSADSYYIEKGAVTFTTSSLAQMTLATEALQTNDTASASQAELRMEFSNPGVLVAGSYISVGLPADLKWNTGSSCSVLQGLEGTAACSYLVADHTIKVVSGLSNSNKSNSDHIVIKMVGVSNPKGMGSYSLSVTVASSADCKYATGYFSLTIDKIAVMESVVITPTNSFLNTYIPYTIEATPRANYLEAGEYFQLSLPADFKSSATVSCQGISSNLLSVTCTRINSTTYKIVPSVDSSAFTSNHTIKLTLSHIGNPSLAGSTTSPIVLTLKTAAGYDYEMHNTTVLTFGNQISPIETSVDFISNYRGYNDSTKYNVRFASYVPAESTVVLNYSAKFKYFSNITLKESSPAMTLTSYNSTSRTLIISLNSPIEPNTSIGFTLNMTNPSVGLIGTEDIDMKFLVGGVYSIFAIRPLPQQEQFICETTCKDCGDFYNICTQCDLQFNLEVGICVPKPITPSQIQQVVRQNEKSVPFIFSGLAIAISTIIFVIGCCLKVRNYWGNFLYALLRPVWLAALLAFVYYVYKNEDPRWFLIASLAFVALHILLSITGTVIVCRALSQGNLGVQTSENKFVNALAGSSKKTQERKKKAFGSLYFFLLYLSPLFGFDLIRWCYSAFKGQKGVLWEFDTPSFSYIKSVLQRCHMVYLFLMTVGIIVVTSVSFAYNIYLFKIDMLALAVIDLLVYVIAYFELNSWKPQPPQKLLIGAVGLNGQMNPNESGARLLDDDDLEANGAKKDKLKLDVDTLKKRMNNKGKLGPFGEEDQDNFLLSHKEDGQSSTNRKLLGDYFDNRPIPTQEMSCFEETNQSPPHKLNEKGDKDFDKTKEKIYGNEADCEQLVSKSRKNQGPSARKRLGSRSKSRSLSSRQKRQKSKPQFDTDSPYSVPPESYMVLNEDGVWVPSLVNQPKREPFGKSDESIDKMLEDSTRNYGLGNQTSENPDEFVFETANKPLADMPSNLKKSTAASKLYNKWFYTTAPNYLEVIYEQNEGEDGVLYENNDYDSKSKKRLGVGSDGEKSFWGKHMQQVLKFTGSEDGDRHIPEGANFESAETIHKPGRIGKLRDTIDAPEDGTYVAGLKGSTESVDPNAYGTIVQSRDLPSQSQDDRTHDVQNMQDEDDENYEYGGGKGAPRVHRGMPGASSAEIEDDLNNLEDEILTRNDKIKLGPGGEVVSINGQSVEDIANNIIRDKSGEILDIKKQSMAEMYRGILVDTTGHKFAAKFNSVNELKKGIIRTQDGQQVLVADQSFKDMAELGILRDNSGSVIEINGQKPEDLSNGIIRVENGRSLIKIEDQKSDKLGRGVLIDPESNKIQVGHPQTIDTLEKGIVVDRDGVQHRIIDQSLHDLKRGNLRDAALTRSQEQVLAKNREQNLKRKGYNIVGPDGIVTDPFGATEIPMQSENNRVNDASITSSVGHSTESPRKKGRWPPSHQISVIPPSADDRYYDKKGELVKVSNLDRSSCLYDSLGNIILLQEDMPLFLDENGRRIEQEDAKKIDKLYDYAGKPLIYNHLGFIHKFFDSEGRLVDYKDLKHSDGILDSEGRRVSIDLLDRKTRLYDGDGKLIPCDQIKDYEEPLYDNKGIKLSGPELVKRQRFYTKEGVLLAQKDLLTSQKLYDIKGREIGLIDNPMGLTLPMLSDKQSRPLDARDAVSKHLFYTRQGEPVTRDDIEKQQKVFSSTGKPYAQKVVEEILDDPDDARRIYNENGKEVDLENQIRESRVRDRSRRLIDGDTLRHSGKIFDDYGNPVNGKVLGRISQLLDSLEKLKSKQGSYEDEINKSIGTARDQSSVGSLSQGNRTGRDGYPIPLAHSETKGWKGKLPDGTSGNVNQVSEPGFEDATLGEYHSDRESHGKTSHYRPIQGLTPVKKLDPTKGKRLQEYMDTLDLNLLANESFELDVNVEEVDDSQDMGHELMIEEPDTVGHRLHTPLQPDQRKQNFMRNPDRTDTIKTQSVHFKDYDHLKRGQTPSETDREDIQTPIQGHRFQNIGLNKLQTNPDWKHPRSGIDSPMNEDSSNPHFGDLKGRKASISHSSKTRQPLKGRNQSHQPTPRGQPSDRDHPGIPKPSADSKPKKAKPVLPSIPADHKHIMGPPVMKNSERVSFVKQYKRKTNLGDHGSSLSTPRVDTLKEIYIDNIEIDRDKHSKALSRHPSQQSIRLTDKHFRPAQGL